MVNACFFFCCLFAPGAMLCVNVTDEVQGLCPFYNQTVEGYLPQIDRNRIIFHFRPLFQARCSPLTNIFFCSSLFPLCLPSGGLLPCRDVCFSVYKSCHHIFLLHGFQWPEYLDCKKLPARPRLCLSPPSPTPLFSVPSISSVWSTSSSSAAPYAPSAPSAPSDSSAPSDPSAHSDPSAPSVSWYYCFIVLGPLLFVILGFSLKRLIPDQEQAVPRITENSVSFSSPSQAPSSPQDQPQDQPPDHPPPPPPLPLKKKHWNTVYVNTQNTTLYATADLY